MICSEKYAKASLHFRYGSGRTTAYIWLGSCRASTHIGQFWVSPNRKTVWKPKG